MLFSSWQFIFLFLPAVLSGFFALPVKPVWVRKVWLLLASFVFYGYWKIEYVPLLLISIGFNYTFAEIVARRQSRLFAKGVLILALALNLSLLGYFKYTNFLVDVFWHFTQTESPHWKIILPLAISFFTFTQIAYLVDVYRNRSLHYRLLDYSFFVVFFPHLIAGPIVRHWEIIPQFAGKTMRATVDDVRVGLSLFLIGLCKKVLLADSVARYVADVYGTAFTKPDQLNWFDAWLGTLAFALQIYFDFSGYSDMAIGLARLFGIKFPVNFNSPYQAASISQFWQRWHVTLTRFLREYVYFPLGGNRCSPARHVFNIMVTMLLSGIWHGAGWTFIIWGGLHGIYLVISHRWRKMTEHLAWAKGHLYCGASVGLTFFAVLVAWVFFRAQDCASAMRMFSTMFGVHGLTIADEVTNPARGSGVFLRHVGFHFVDKAFSADYSTLFMMIALMMAIALALPNSQQLLASFTPALEPVKAPARLRLALDLRSGLCLGMAFFLVVRTFYAAAPSPFLYFNF